MDVFEKLRFHKKKKKKKLSKIPYPLVKLEDKLVLVDSVINLTVVIKDEKCKRSIYA